MKHILKIISFAIASIACEGYKPYFKSIYPASPYSSKLGIKDCSSDKNYITKNNSTITWRATKIDELGAESTLTGTNQAIGNLKLKNSSKTAVADIDFVGSTTNSEDPIRDSRISSFVFGLSDAIPFGFRLTGITGDKLDVKDDERRIATAIGTLFVFNQESEIHIPILIKDYQGLVTITPTDVFKLNVRTVTPTINGVSLGERISQLLTLVPGVQMKDEVMIDFNLEFALACE